MNVYGVSLCVEFIVTLMCFAVVYLQEGFDGQMTEDNIEIGICNVDGFKRLHSTDVKDYLAAVL